MKTPTELKTLFVHSGCSESCKEDKTHDSLDSTIFKDATEFYTRNKNYLTEDFEGKIVTAIKANKKYITYTLECSSRIYGFFESAENRLTTKKGSPSFCVGIAYLTLSSQRKFRLALECMMLDDAKSSGYLILYTRLKQGSSFSETYNARVYINKLSFYLYIILHPSKIHKIL